MRFNVAAPVNRHLDLAVTFVYIDFMRLRFKLTHIATARLQARIVCHVLGPGGAAIKLSNRTENRHSLSHLPYSITSTTVSWMEMTFSK